MHLRKLTASLLLTLLAGCPSDDVEETSTGDGTTEAGSTGATTQDETSTSGSTSTAASGSTSDTGDASSSTTGPTIGCTPGDPCCNEDGAFEGCWIDDATGLVWELDPGGGNPSAVDALAYCDQLTLVDSGGWRLPTVDELRTLVGGCPDTQTGGACGITDDCPTPECRNDACDGCIDAPNEGPGMFGCYLDPNLRGECGRYWTATDPGGGFGLLVDFDDATVRQADAALPAGLVRCVAN